MAARLNKGHALANVDRVPPALGAHAAKHRLTHNDLHEQPVRQRMIAKTGLMVSTSLMVIGAITGGLLLGLVGILIGAVILPLVLMVVLPLVIVLSAFLRARVGTRRRKP